MFASILVPKGYTNQRFWWVPKVFETGQIISYLLRGPRWPYLRGVCFISEGGNVLESLAEGLYVETLFRDNFGTHFGKFMGGLGVNFGSPEAPWRTQKQARHPKGASRSSLEASKVAAGGSTATTGHPFGVTF